MKPDYVRRPFRGSPTARAIGSVIFCIFIVAYVTVISVSLVPRLPQPRALAALLFVWAIALLAVVIIARAWRRSRARTSEADAKTPGQV